MPCSVKLVDLPEVYLVYMGQPYKQLKSLEEPIFLSDGEAFSVIKGDMKVLLVSFNVSVGA